MKFGGCLSPGALHRATAQPLPWSHPTAREHWPTIRSRRPGGTVQGSRVGYRSMSGRRRRSAPDDLSGDDTILREGAHIAHGLGGQTVGVEVRKWSTAENRRLAWLRQASASGV